jgi:DNA-binding SARP family transcriptional activator
LLSGPGNARTPLVDDPTEVALDVAEQVDDRLGYGTFFYDPDDHEDLDEFATDVWDATTVGPPSELALGTGAALEVNVLGPLEVVGWLKVPTRKVLTELACYLALHPGRPLTGDELRAALWGREDAGAEASAKSLRTYMSELRRSLAPGLVPSGRGGYGFSGDVTTDWGRFCDLVRRAEQEPIDEAMLLRSALELVRGQPFAGVDYQWVYAEFLVSQMEVAITSAARRLAEIATAQGDHGTALFALRRGLLACPFDFALWEGALRASAELGPDELSRTWRDASAALGADADELAQLVAELQGPATRG